MKIKKLTNKLEHVKGRIYLWECIVIDNNGNEIEGLVEADVDGKNIDRNTLQHFND